ILLRFLILSISYFIFILPVYFAGFSLFHTGFWPVYGIFILAFVLNFAYRYFLPKIKNFESFITVQIIIDIILVSALVYLTGANYSNFVFLYFATILGSSILTATQRGALLTTLCALFLIIITAIYMLHFIMKNWVPPFCIREIFPGLGDSFYLLLGYLIIEILSFYLVFFLSNDLTKRFHSVKLLYDEVLLNMADGMLIIDVHNRIQFINQEALNLLRFKERSQLIGKQLEEVFRRSTDKEIKECLSQSENIKKEIEFRIGADDLVILEIKSSIIHDEKGRKKLSIVILRDLSLHKHALETEKRLTKLEAVREMSAEIAHEIKNPLASIFGSAQELAKIQMTDPIHEKLIRIVSEETERINEIVNSFLTFARMPPTKLEKCHLSNLLEEIVIMLQNRIIDKTIIFNKNVQTDLFCEGDRNQLKQVFLNLGINALESIDENGSVTLIASQITLKPQSNLDIQDRRRPVIKPDIEVRISDTGTGIDPEIIEKIYKPFFTTKSSGTGMGLAIAEWIVHAHNAKMSCVSKKGQGTTFIITIPAF
ncbi:MAG: hypothetical protein A2161_09780, partial [Candidatus Schekmanbacteria bacterium RBG_13_48_7]